MAIISDLNRFYVWLVRLVYETSVAWLGARMSEYFKQLPSLPYKNDRDFDCTTELCELKQPAKSVTRIIYGKIFTITVEKMSTFNCCISIWKDTHLYFRT